MICFFRCLRCLQTASMLSVNQGAFVVGTDGGTVYRCMFHHSTQMEAEFIRTVSENGKPNLRSPIKAEFSGHSGARISLRSLCACQSRQSRR